MGPSITVYVQPNVYPSDDDYAFCIPLEEQWAKDEMIALDEPTNAPSAWICESKMSTKKRYEIRRRREIHAKGLAEKIEKHIIEFFGQNDTKDGYPKPKER